MKGEKPSVELWEIMRSEDLEISLSLGFVVRGTLKTFAEIRALIEEHLKDKKGEFFVYGLASPVNIKLIKRKEGNIRVKFRKKGKKQ